MKTKGITTKKNTKGEQPKIGVVEENVKELSDFRKRFNEGSTVEEAMNRTLEKIRKLKW